MDNTTQIIFESLDGTDLGYSGVLRNNEVYLSTNCCYEIPSRYFVDSLTLMAINPNKFYIYWEVTDETLEKFRISLSDVKLHISVVDERDIEITSFESPFSVGDYYCNHTKKSKILTAKLNLVVDGDSFVPILVSNRLKLFDPILKGYTGSPLYSDFVFDGQEGESGMVDFDSTTLKTNNNLSSHTILNKGN